MQRKWFGILAMAGVLVMIVAACGRVNLEDLTPEAVKTEQAQAQLTEQAVAEQFGLGDARRGRVTWGTWCVGCHAAGGNGRGPDLIGQAFDLAQYEDAFRNEGAPLPDGNPHPITYAPTDLNENQFQDIFAYLATAGN